MARKNREETEVVNETTQTTEAPAATGNAAATSGYERFRFVTDPDTGAQVKRKDYILKCWKEKKMSRGQIAKHLTELSGKKVAYQVVFATIKKGTPGGPDKVEQAAAA